MNEQYERALRLHVIERPQGTVTVVASGWRDGTYSEAFRCTIDSFPDQRERVEAIISGAVHGWLVSGLGGLIALQTRARGGRDTL